jgi:iron complex outermembrane receptor protein
MPTAPTMAAPVTTLAFNASYNLTQNLCCPSTRPT